MKICDARNAALTQRPCLHITNECEPNTFCRVPELNVCMLCIMRGPLSAFRMMIGIELCLRCDGAREMLLHYLIRKRNVGVERFVAMAYEHIRLLWFDVRKMCFLLFNFCCYFPRFFESLEITPFGKTGKSSFGWKRIDVSTPKDIKLIFIEVVFQINLFIERIKIW